jgi:hypothetical protein
MYEIEICVREIKKIQTCTQVKVRNASNSMGVGVLGC